MQEKTLRLGIESPHEISDDLFKELTGLIPSHHCFHDTRIRIGKELIPSSEEIIKHTSQMSYSTACYANGLGN